MIAQEEITKIKPQKGKQQMFLSSQADIAIYGGAAGGGKSYGLLLEALRNTDTPGFTAVVFRRNSTQVRNLGGLWDTSQALYRAMDGVAKETTLHWSFPSGAQIKFAHLEHVNTVYDWQGSQICLIAFDELTHFHWNQFTYMLSRNRSECGVTPYIRCTTNPDPDHWSRDFISWWIDSDSGLPIEDRAGVIRWFIIRNNDVIWADTKKYLTLEYPKSKPKSCTFIPASVHDNKILLTANPEYLASLEAMREVDKERLLNGNWNVRETAGSYFTRDMFEIIDKVPRGFVIQKQIRYWDRAATEESKAGKKTSFTAGLKTGIDQFGTIYFLDLEKFRGSPMEVANRIKETAERDGKDCRIGIEQDPGQAGVGEAQSHVRNLLGYNVTLNAVHEAKGVRAKPLSCQAEAGNVKLIRALWNDNLLRTYENFDGSKDCMADEVDAGSGGLLLLTSGKRAGVWGTN